MPFLSVCLPVRLKTVAFPRQRRTMLPVTAQHEYDTLSAVLALALLSFGAAQAQDVAELLIQRGLPWHDYRRHLTELSEEAQMMTRGGQRFRLFDGQTNDLKPIADYFAEAAAIITNYSGDEQIRRMTNWLNKKRPLPDWQMLIGKVLQVTDGEGILVTVHPNGDTEEDGELVRVKNSRRERTVVDNDFVAVFAIEDGRYRYVNVSGAASTVRSFDFGTLLTDEQIAALLKSEADTREAAKAKAQAIRAQAVAAGKLATQKREFQFWLEKANAGETYAQLRVGQLYLTGEGVESNQSKAVEWLTKAAAAGDQDAKSALEKLK
jgi:hypothetical protein